MTTRVAHADAQPNAIRSADTSLNRTEVESIRREYPIFCRHIRGKPLVYLDNAATAQKPRSVIDAVSEHYANRNANVHRGVHLLSQEATQAYEAARDATATFLGAESAKEIVFVRGATEAINLVAQACARPMLSAGDEILITHLEHHSNIVPWQLVCKQTGATLRVAPIDDTGAVNLERFTSLLTDRTKICAFAHISNALGTVNPVAKMTALAKQASAIVLIDGAQAAPHTPIDVQAIGCDFYTITGHKCFGPTGIGALFGKTDLLESMAPYQGGGEMIASVSFDKSTWNDIPHKFEAGTPNIAGAAGWHAAIEHLNTVGLSRIAAWEAGLIENTTARLASLPGVRIIGTATTKAAVVSFDVESIHPHDVAAVLDNAGVAVRAGHHCAQPVMERFGVAATTRASFAFYNTPADVDALISGVEQAIAIFR